MRLLCFHLGSELRLGLARDARIADLAAAADVHGIAAPTSPEAFYRQGQEALPALRALAAALEPSAGYWRDEGGLRLAPAVPHPGKILCVGLNYSRHAAEAGMPEPKQPVLFSKFNNALAAHGDPVPIGGLEQVDYEAELAVVIGRRAKGVRIEDALGHVLGYCNANDLSERVLQFLSGQWLLGKTLDRFLPLGPYLVTADEVPDPQALRVRGWLNGELRQDSSTSDMIFGVAEIIAYASRTMTLEPGDVIITGTPEGVVQGMAPQVWLKPGDVYAVEVDGLGRLENRLTE